VDQDGIVADVLTLRFDKKPESLAGSLDTDNDGKIRRSWPGWTREIAER
jgi:hypothetical protein